MKVKVTAVAAALIGLALLPATAQAERLPTLTKTDSWKSLGYCYDGPPCHHGSHKWQTVTGRDGRERAFVYFFRDWTSSAGRCERVNRLTVDCFKNYQRRYNRDEAWSNYPGNWPPSWTCTETVRVRMVWLDEHWPGYPRRAYPVHDWIGPDCPPMPEPALGWSEV